jgi:hypothetical protein
VRAEIVTDTTVLVDTLSYSVREQANQFMKRLLLVLTGS